MKITIEQFVTVEKKVEVDVNFPIYREYYLPSYDGTILQKVESLDRQVNIYLYDDDLSHVALKIDKPSFRGDMDYLLGEGVYKLDKEEFEDAVTKVKALANCC